MARAPVLEEVRGDRLMMRAHKDLVEMLDARAHEAGESRSRYIEKLLVAFLRMDPRNPKIDPWGRIDPNAPEPGAPSKRAPEAERLAFGARWGKWKELNVLLGFRAPSGDAAVADEIGYHLWKGKQPPGLTRANRGVDGRQEAMINPNIGCSKSRIDE